MNAKMDLSTEKDNPVSGHWIYALTHEMRAGGLAPYMTAMTITYARPPKRQRPPKPPQPALTAAIVTPRKRGRPKPPDPEAEARAMAWIAAQLRPRGT
jgi:hypothetical protein